MAQQPATRERKLREILEQLRRGETVQNRTLRTWLGEEAYAEIEEDWRGQQQLRDDLKDKPSAVRVYEERLRLAVLAYNKGEGASTRGKHKTAKVHFAKADMLFERALEYLQEIMTADRGLCVWFDRDTEWTTDSDLGLTPSSVPLVVTSRSLDNAGGGMLRQLRSKRDVKISVIERALDALNEVEQDDDPATQVAVKAQLDDFLKLRDDEVL